MLINFIDVSVFKNQESNTDSDKKICKSLLRSQKYKTLYESPPRKKMGRFQIPELH